MGTPADANRRDGRATRGLKNMAEEQQQNKGPQNRPPRENRGPNEGRPNEGRGGAPRGDRGDRAGGGYRGERPGGDARGGERRFETPDIDLDKLIADSLYLDNQAHGVVSRIKDMDSGTKTQLRRLYNAVRRAVRAPENERQHQFVMLRARLAYTIARHSLRSLDQIEKLLLQVTRRNDARGYERFRDLFEAIVAYNE
jgi:CRISPR type III-A-associated protein Csm2